MSLGQNLAPARLARTQYPPDEAPHRRADDGVAEPRAATGRLVAADIAAKRTKYTERYCSSGRSRDQPWPSRIITHPQPAEPTDSHYVRRVLLAEISPEHDLVTSAAQQWPNDASVAGVERCRRFGAKKPAWGEPDDGTTRNRLLRGQYGVGGCSLAGLGLAKRRHGKKDST